MDYQLYLAIIFRIPVTQASISIWNGSANGFSSTFFQGWEALWSKEKQDYCCTHMNKACDRFDCQYLKGAVLFLPPDFLDEGSGPFLMGRFRAEKGMNVLEGDLRLVEKGW